MTRTLRDAHSERTPRWRGLRAGPLVCIVLVLVNRASVEAANVQDRGVSQVFSDASAWSDEFVAHHNNVKPDDQAVPLPAPSSLASTASKLPPSLDGDGLLQRHTRAITNDTNVTKDDTAVPNAIVEAPPPVFTEPRVIAIRLQEVSKDVSYNEDGTVYVKAGSEVLVTLHGWGFTNLTDVKVTTAAGQFGGTCHSNAHFLQTSVQRVVASSDGLEASLVIPKGQLPAADDNLFYFCLKAEESEKFVHQGTNESVTIHVFELILPIWIMVIFLIVLLMMSGLFSGLNLGLMSLDQTELKIISNTGTETEKRYASRIAPIRRHGNYLLCSILLGNVLVNNTLTILMDSLTSGLVAVLGSTMAIVIFGEIVPQAVCSRHGLAVGANTVFITKFFMLLTFPLAFPISKILDRVLGAEIGTTYDKKRLIELLRVTHETNDLEKEEVDIVTGALVYKDKTVRHVMTKLEDCYMLPLTAVLDFDTVSDIREQGYSRIPVYDSDDRKNIVHILFAKDLMFVDPDDRLPLTMVCEFYNNEVNFVFHDTPLNIMFNEFKSGEKGHMAFVQDINTGGDGDPFYETIGLVTLEDIIEEIIQQEIVDETDVITDNKTKRKRLKGNKPGGGGQDGRVPNFYTEERKTVAISPQLAMAVFQYLTTSIVPFKAVHINENVLKKLLAFDVFKEIKMKKDRTKMNEADLIIIEKGKPIDFFVLIIEGRVEVNIGREELVFESGPFTYFGIQTLLQAMETSPSTPSLAMNRAETMPSSLLGPDVAPALVAATTVSSFNPRASLRKASTHATLDFSPANPKRNDSIITVAPNYTSQSVVGVQPFVPDYTVKATTDTLYLVIKRAAYLAAIKATQMGKKQNASSEMLEREIDHLLARTHDEGMGIGTGMGMGLDVDGAITMIQQAQASQGSASPAPSSHNAVLSSSNRFEAIRENSTSSSPENSGTPHRATSVLDGVGIDFADSEEGLPAGSPSNNGYTLVPTDTGDAQQQQAAEAPRAVPERTSPVKNGSGAGAGAEEHIGKSIS